MEKKSKNIENFKDIVKKQFDLNCLTAGNQWHITQVNSKTGKNIKWNRCSWMEMAEFIESFDWKHWKKGKEDIENAKVELVDILHFLTSQLIVEEYQSLKYLETNEEKKLNDIFNNLSHRWNTVFLLTDSFNNNEELLDLADLFVSGMFDEKISDITLIIFARMCIILDLEPTELYKRYMVKNILNQFRQEHGYAEGTYIKNWNIGYESFEDNVITYRTASKLILENINVSENLYKELEKIYSTLE